MDVLEAIFTRRTIKDFRPDAVPDEALARALTAGLWAQNHRLTEPWRFTLIGPEARARLAAAFGAAQAEALPSMEDPAAREKVRATAERKILSKPAIVAVSCRTSQDPQQSQEDYAAVACAVQNIQLAAWAEGLGMQWGSSKHNQRPEIYALLGISPDAEELAGLLFFGYPAAVPKAQPRKPLDEVSRRLP